MNHDHSQVEVLSCIRHPNMVLLLGACPEYGCLVYEFMANGSLDDRLFCRGGSPPLSWQLRFRIAAEIGTGLLFLHQSKPEPLVHRDLKPGNILLDRNFVSKISDVGLARLVPPSLADTVTQYRMTSTAGTFCYIDPEYQQTGMLGVKSDIYSIGIMFLQLITAKPPMGLTHHVERAIEKGTFTQLLDPAVTDWPVEETLCFAKLALKCSELRRKDRPDLGKDILPELNRLRAIAEETMHPTVMFSSPSLSPSHSQVSLQLGAPDFCNVYVISKGKIQSMRSASRPAPPSSPFRSQLINRSSIKSDAWDPNLSQSTTPKKGTEKPPVDLFHRMQDETDIMRSPFSRKGYDGRSYGELTLADTDISFVSSARPSIEQMFTVYDNLEIGSTPTRMSFTSTEVDMKENFDIMQIGPKSLEIGSPPPEFSTLSPESDRLSNASQTAEDVETEMRRLKLELKQTMEMYSTACKEALTAKQKAVELQRWKLEEERRLQEAQLAEEAALALAEKEKAKSRAAIEAAEAAKRIAELEGQKRINAEMKVLQESEEKRKVEVLSCIRHPNMVLLLGACPEYGCLVYEFMANGSLDDRLFCRGGSPPLSWQLRFRIAAEIGTGLLFLHQSKPEPLVHRDLKPGNILLDRNFVSKISDVGLARLVPPSLADTVTQYRMTSTAGTFCYIDPEYQQTGMLGVKSDIYSIGIMFLQLITAKPPMGLTHHVERAIEKGTFTQLLDPAVTDWPVEETLCFAKLALKCSELRRKDRPDLGKDILPELNRLRAIAEETMHPTVMFSSPSLSPSHSQVSLQLDEDLPHEHSDLSSKHSSTQ
ncbi:u-box domain-containing protein 35 [Quercus suber]|uniref:RING-type E3 ubiquitin transferase n=1 Tax=Quercus suber TaxID=58331 RepID=A0AAW0LE27_QUESU